MRVGKANGQQWLRLAEAAAILGVSHNTLRQWSDTGRVRCYRSPGGHRRYRRADIAPVLVASPPHGIAERGSDDGTDDGRPEPALDALVHVAADWTATTSCCIAVQESDDVFRIVAAHGDAGPLAVGTEHAFSSLPVEAEVVHGRRRLHIPDVARTHLLPRATADEYCRDGVLGLLVLPIELPNGRFGVLRLGDSRGPHAFDSEAVSFAEFVAGHAGVLLAGGGHSRRDHGATDTGAPDETQVADGAAPAAAAPGTGDAHAHVRGRERDLALLEDAWLQDASRWSAEHTLRDLVERVAAVTRAPIVEIYAVEGNTARALVSYDGGRWDTAWEDVVLRLDRYPTSLRAVETGHVVTVNGLDDDALGPDGRFSLERWGYQSHLSVPLVAGGRTLGLLDIYDYVPHDFSPDVELVRGLARVAAVTMHNERLSEQARRRGRAISELEALASLCARASDPAALVATVAERVQAALDAASCQIFRLTSEGVLCVAGHDRSGRDDDAVGRVTDFGAYPTAVSTLDASDVLVVTSLEDERLTADEKAAYRANGWASEICAPLVVGDRVSGLIDVLDSRSRGFAEDADFMRCVAGMVSVTLEAAGLRDELARRGRDLASLASIGVSDVGADLGGEALERLAAEVRRHLDAADCDVFALDDQGLRCLVSVDADGRDDSISTAALDLSSFPATAQAVRSGTIVEVSDLDDPRLSDRERADMATWGFRSEVCVPLVADGRVHGVIDVFDTRPRDFTAHREYLAAAGRVASGIVGAALAARGRGRAGAATGVAQREEPPAGRGGGA